MNDISKTILEQIKNKKIELKPKWQFMMLRILLWIASIISVLIGSLAFSVILYMLINNDWDIYERLGRTPLQHAFLSLPYLYLIILVAFIALAYINAKHTKKGYKYNSYLVVIASLLFSIGLGGILYTFGLGARIDFAMSDRLPQLHQFFYNRDDAWTNPTLGLLAGEIIDLNSDEIVIIDKNGIEWEVLIDKYDILFSVSDFEVGDQVRIIGEMEDDKFMAISIRSWHELGPGIFPQFAPPLPGPKGPARIF
ncbi:MAG: hypothetical protein ABIE68_01625 [bacterium]